MNKNKQVRFDPVKARMELNIPANFPAKPSAIFDSSKRDNYNKNGEAFINGVFASDNSRSFYIETGHLHGAWVRAGKPKGLEPVVDSKTKKAVTEGKMGILNENCNYQTDSEGVLHLIAS